MLLGAHVPITGGLFHAPGNGDAVGAEAIQIFTRNQMQWASRPLSDEESAALREARRRDRLCAVHLNDSKRERGSGVDRHARAGQGHLGLSTFRRILNDPRLSGVPMVVETPGPLAEWKKEIALLRGLVR